MNDPLGWLERLRQYGLGLDMQLRTADRAQHYMAVPSPEEIEAAYFDTGPLAERQMKRAAFLWLLSGLPCVHLGHSLAAELLYADVSNGPDLPKPWPSFAVYLPPGLLRSAVACLVATELTPEQGIWVMAADGVGIQSVNVDSIGELLSAEDKGSIENPSVPWPLCQRLVALVCAELAVHRPTQAPPSRNQTIKRDKRTDEPLLWNFQLTRPVTVDCREAVREWSQSDKAHDPSAIYVRTHVRGHYKRIAHGKRLALKKWGYIKPYPRNNERAPLAVKNHKLEGGHTE